MNKKLELKRVLAVLLSVLLLLTIYFPPVSAKAEDLDIVVIESENETESAATQTDAVTEEEIIVTDNIYGASGSKATASDVVAATSTNKKGVQGTEWHDTDSAVRDADPSSLNINHVLFNLDLSKIISTNNTGTPFVYNGKTYYFNYDNYLIFYEWRIRELREEGKIVTVVLLMPWSTDPSIQKLIYPGARQQGHYYYALNVDDAEASATLAAAFHYLAEVFGYSDTFVQNWIIGNEVNVPEEYNYTGTTDKTTNVNICAKSFDLLYKALQDNSPYAKAYISLTHNWQNNNGGNGIPTKDFLSAFASKESGKNWNLAFHAYPPNMTVSVRSAEAAKWLRHDSATSFICGANLEQLTNYMKSTYGTSHRIILSEQSYDSGNLGENEQAAMIAYTYYAGARDDMVDAVIFSSWSDSAQTSHMGYKLGIVNSDGSKKAAYNVFKYMNTSTSTYSNQCLSTLGISAWTDDILYKAPTTSNYVTSASLYLAEQTRDRIMIGLTTETSGPVDIEYRWVVCNTSDGKWSVASDWTLNYEWLIWTPPTYGNYYICCEFRVPGNPSSTGQYMTEIEHHPVIKGKCQMPYTGEGGGYLIGVESYENPNQSYQYEMLILDCTKLAAGEPPWVYTTGKRKAPEGNAAWTIWQPQYGYYWTLFRVYDANGVLLDESCYGFVNAY